MKKALMLGAGVLLACLAIGPATASAAGVANGTVVACIGAGTDDGSFQPQVISTGTIPGVGLGLSEPLCVVLQPSALFSSVTNILGNLKTLRPPSTLPSQADLEALITAIQNIQPGPLAALELAFVTCTTLHMSNTCSTLLGTALGAPVPLGTATLQGNGEPCFTGQQTGTGSVAGPSFLLLNWSANYVKGASLLGVIRGSADSVFEGDKMYNLNGLIGPMCGPGVKALVLTVSSPT
jgi:hypothetical protein